MSKDNSIVDGILKEITECKDTSKLKELTDKLKDAMALSDNPQNMRKELLTKWAKKLEPLLKSGEDERLAVVANMLEMQYTFLTKHVNALGFLESKNEIEILEKQADKLPEGEGKKALTQLIKEKKKNLPKSYDETFAWRGVNVYDEIVKFFDCMKTKDIVGMQPLFGPVGLAYAMRFKPLRETPKKKITMQELIDQHNFSSGFDPGKIQTIEKLEDLREHQLEAYRSKYMIEGDPLSQESEFHIEEQGLTVDQKEVVAKTQKCVMSGVEKVTGGHLADVIDTTIINTITNLKPPKFITKDKLREKCRKAQAEIFANTKIGEGNYILSKNDLGKDVTEIFDYSINVPVMDENTIIIAYSGNKEMQNGVIYCPYVTFLPKITEDCDEKNTEYMTRFGIIDSLKGTKDFYEIFEYFDCPQEHIDFFYQFIANTKKNCDTDEQIKDILPLSIMLFKRLSDNFNKRIPVVTKKTGTARVALKTHWSIEAQYDLQQLHNIDVEVEIIDMVCWSLKEELDKILKNSEDLSLHSIDVKYTDNKPNYTIIVKK